MARSVPAGDAAQPVPVEGDGRRLAPPCDPGRGDRRSGPIPRDRRGRDAPVSTSPSPARRSTCTLLGHRSPTTSSSAIARSSSTTSPRRPWVSTAPAPVPGHPADAAAAPGDSAGHAVVLGAQVPLRVPLPVQAAVPVRLQRADPRGARLREGATRRLGRDPQAGARRRHRHPRLGRSAHRPPSQHAFRLPSAARAVARLRDQGDRALLRPPRQGHRQHRVLRAADPGPRRARASPSTGASTSSAGSTPARSRSSTSSPPSAPRRKT